MLKNLLHKDDDMSLIIRTHAERQGLVVCAWKLILGEVEAGGDPCADWPTSLACSVSPRQMREIPFKIQGGRLLRNDTHY